MIARVIFGAWRWASLAFRLGVAVMMLGEAGVQIFNFAEPNHWAYVLLSLVTAYAAFVWWRPDY